MLKIELSYVNQINSILYSNSDDWEWITSIFTAILIYKIIEIIYSSINPEDDDTKKIKRDEYGRVIIEKDTGYGVGFEMIVKDLKDYISKK